MDTSVGFDNLRAHESSIRLTRNFVIRDTCIDIQIISLPIPRYQSSSDQHTSSTPIFYALEVQNCQPFVKHQHVPSGFNLITRLPITKIPPDGIPECTTLEARPSAIDDDNDIFECTRKIRVPVSLEPRVYHLRARSTIYAKKNRVSCPS